MANDTKEIVDSLHEAAKNAVNTVYSDCTEVIERLREHESDTNWDAQLGEEINTLKRETGDLWENKKQFGLDQIDKLSGDVADTATELYQVMLGLLQRFIVTAVKWLQQAQDNASDWSQNSQSHIHDFEMKADEWSEDILKKIDWWAGK